MKHILLSVFRSLLRFFAPIPKDVLKNKAPISFVYGLDRGTPIDRLYIEDFLGRNKDRIRGACLEIADNAYTLRFGDGSVTRSDVLDIDSSNKKATIVGDLRNLPNIPDNSYDCIILTQVLQFIDDSPSAVREVHRILKPGGTVLATLPFISRIDCVAGQQGDFWRFTAASARFLFEKYFSKDAVEAKSRGNFLSGVAFWMGAAQEDVDTRDLMENDDNFPCIITVRATK